MEIEILSMISNASINGYYDPSLGLVVVWFHNMGGDKPDLVAYLMHAMNWDLREVISEKSELFVDKEVIEIEHSPIQVFEKGSDFDKTVRKVLNQLTEYSASEDGLSPRLEMMKMILDSDSYNIVRN